MTSSGPGEQSARLRALVMADPWRVGVLDALAHVDADAWITGGFVRNCVWDDAHGLSERSPVDDVDVVLFAPAAEREHREDALAASLEVVRPDVPWSVHDQARMHVRSGDRPYSGLSEALSHFPDTASAVAARLVSGRRLDVLAPLGLDDLFRLIVRPTPHAMSRGCDIYTRRMRLKEVTWRRNWPRLTIESCGRSGSH